MDQLTPQDALRYEQLKKAATTDILAFRSKARQSAVEYPRPTRQLLERASTKDTPAYLLLTEWLDRIAPDVDAVRKARQTTPLKNSLSKHLLMSGQAATDLAKRLVEERVDNMREGFLDLCYNQRGFARGAARAILRQSTEEINDMRERLVNYELHLLVASEFGATIYDANAPALQRFFQKNAEKRQIARYKKQQAKRLGAIYTRQQELKEYRQAIISRILLVELDTVVALDAYRQYQKHLDRLKPESRTPAKRLSVFTSATKKIRDDYASKQSKTDKLADLQSAQQVIDEVLVELFDMTDAQRNKLMAHLKEYRDLEREAARITKEQATYAD